MYWQKFGINTERALYKKIKGPYDADTKLYYLYRERIQGVWKYGFNDDACIFSKKRALHIIRGHLTFLEVGRVEYEGD